MKIKSLKEKVIHIHNVILKVNIPPLTTTWTDPERTVLNRVSQTERQVLYAIVHMWNLKKSNP